MDERPILVVEDDADINALLAKIAAREGFGCVQAYSGTEALLQMERAAFDLVLLDMMLPGMDGPTLMACMRDELASRAAPRCGSERGCGRGRRLPRRRGACPSRPAAGRRAPPRDARGCRGGADGA